MPLTLSRRIQAALPVMVADSYVRIAKEYEFETEIGDSRVLRDPVGVVAAITPWNYPLHQIVAKIAPALIAGNTVVVKASELAPRSAAILAEVARAVELPPGVLNLLFGLGEMAGEALCAHPDVDMLSFTGSTATGRRVAEVAARSVKRVTLELGGKSPSLVLEDADLERAVRSTVKNAFLNSGQTCTAWTRLLVPEALLGRSEALAVETAESFVLGDPTEESTSLGPLVSEQQRERVRGFIRSGLDQGARLLTGGADAPDALDRGWFVTPTVFSDVPASAGIAQEEIFGPVLSIFSYQDEDEAVCLANDTIYGLAAVVWSNSIERARETARKIRAGQVDLNGARFNPLAPFGGRGQSGLGRELGVHGLEEFLELKAVQGWGS